jgi:flavin reductase (DIM6/NTAB) family NADH-FMN oxidoreductase RutF
MAFDASAFRTTMSHFATGVTVVTTALDQAYFGLTVNAFCSVSLKPPLILISLDLNSQTYPVLQQSGIFAVNILSREQQDLARRFARKDIQSKTFHDIPLSIGETGAPLFTEALAWIECRVAQEVSGGDHMLILGEVLNLKYHDGLSTSEPLLYYCSSFRTFTAEPLVINQSVVLKTPLPTYEEEKAKSALVIGKLLPAAHLFSFEA